MRSVQSSTLRAILALALVAGCGRGHSEATMDHPQHSPEALSLGRITPREPATTLELLSRCRRHGQPSSCAATALWRQLSPPLRWTPVEGAGAYALILEDPDADGE